MADENSGNTPIAKSVDLKAAIAKFLPGQDVRTDDSFGILFNKKPDEVDDLTEISGIGPKNAEKLNEMGVYRFSQIASWTAKVAETIGDKMEFPGRIEREDWVPQAIALAKPAEPVIKRSPRPQMSDYDRIRHLFKDEPVRVDQDLGFVYHEAYDGHRKEFVADDLTRISGVGPVLAQKLNETGIYRFKQIANWNQYNVEEFSERLDFPGRIEREDWIPQARRLMKEDAEKGTGMAAPGKIGAGKSKDDDATTPMDDETTAIADDATAAIDEATTAIDEPVKKVGAGIKGAIGAGAAAAAGAVGIAATGGDDTTPIEDDATSPIEDDATSPIEDTTTKISSPPVGVPGSPKSDTARINIPEAKPSTAKSDTSRLNLKSESGQIPVEDDIFKQQTMPINLDNPKGETSKLSISEDDTTPIEAGDTAPVQAKLAKSKSDTSKIEIGDFSPDDDVFKGQTMPMGDILESDTAQLQDADTIPMDDLDEGGVGITPVPGVPDAAKNTTMPIADLGDEKGKPKIKRPSQLKPKTIKRPSTMKPAPAEAAGIAASADAGVTDAPKTVKLKRPGAGTPEAGGDTPKTVKLKKAPGTAAPSTDSTKKTVKLQKRPAPSQGGLKLNKDGGAAAEEPKGKKKKKKRKSRGRFGIFWLILSLLTFFLAAAAIMTFLNSAYPEDQNNNQAMSWTFPFKGVDANIPFPKPKSTGAVLPPVKKRDPLPLPSAAEGAVNATLDDGTGGGDATDGSTPDGVTPDGDTPEEPIAVP